MFRHIDLLVTHTIKTYKQLYVKYPKISMYFPMQVMYRCFMLARTIMYYELVSIFAPEEITIDVFELLKT